MAAEYLSLDGSPVVEGFQVREELQLPLDRDAWETVFQILEIKVLQLGEKKSAKISGKIYFKYQYGIWDLYNRTKENAETIDVPGALTVTPPIFGVLPYDYLLIKLDLESGLEELNRRGVVWRPNEYPHDKLRVVKARGKNCCMEVRFIVFSEALLADIEIDLLNMHNEEGIYGTITAAYSEKPELGQLFMFNKTLSDNVSAKEGEPVPLTMPFITLPYDSSLDIIVNLHTVSDEPIAGGTITFWPESLGKWSGTLGKSGEIQVRAKVEFSAYHKHETTTRAGELYGFPSEESDDE